MSIKEKFGEISKKDLINIGDKVTVKYYEIGIELKSLTGILMNATPDEIIINGATPLQKIKIEKIIEIKKV